MRGGNQFCQSYKQQIIGVYSREGWWTKKQARNKNQTFCPWWIFMMHPPN